MRWRRIRRVPRGWPLLLLTLLSAACRGPDTGPEEAFRATAEPEAGVSVDAATGERLIRDYFQAVQEGRGADAREMLAPGPRSDASAHAFEAAARSLRSLHVSALRLLEAEPERLVFAADVEVEPATDQAGEWERGVNRRWIELTYGWRGWRIARISPEPPATETWSRVAVWGHVHILEGGLSLDVPNAWQQLDGQWQWTPTGSGWPNTGVRWVDAPPDAELESLLPAGARLVRSVPIELDWGTGTLYTLELPDPSSPDSIASFEQHLLVRAGDRRIYTIYARAASAEEMRRLQWVLRRMFLSSELLGDAMLAARASRPECRGVRRIDPGSAEGRQVAGAVRAALGQRHGSDGRPELERIGPITVAAGWVLVDLSFRGQLEPAIFALHAEHGEYRFHDVAWSGAAAGGEEEIRGAMAARLPRAPPELFRCADLGRWLR